MAEILGTFEQAVLLAIVRRADEAGMGVEFLDMPAGTRAKLIDVLTTKVAAASA